MNKNSGYTPAYETPQMEVLEIIVEQAILQMSGIGSDSDDFELC